MDGRLWNVFAAETEVAIQKLVSAGWHNRGVRFMDALHNRTEAMGRFTQHVYPPAVHTLPVLYPFAGVDLLTAHALFPHAPEYSLLADLPLGNLSCVAHRACRKQAVRAAIDFFTHCERGCESNRALAPAAAYPTPPFRRVTQIQR